MSGNYDFPPASSNRGSRVTPPDRREYVNITTRLQHLRNLLSSQREGPDSRAAMQVLHQELDDYRSTPSQEPLPHNTYPDNYVVPTVPPRSNRSRRRVNLEPERDRGERASLQMQTQTQIQTPRSSAGVMEQEPEPALTRQRRRSMRPSETWATSREPRTTRPSLVNNEEQAAGIFRDPSVNSVLNSAQVDETLPRLGSPDVLEDPWGPIPLEPDQIWEPQTDRWRAKRRKLDSEDHRDSSHGFSYGRYGQVVPGTLKMEIASCDGGAYCEPNGESSLPENVLLNDSSVYCTKSDRCNLILKHKGETPFCLRKIVIKAPKSGFDAPIQEGLIFVSMTSEELLERTSQYRISYTPPGNFRRRNRSSADPRRTPSEQYMAVIHRYRQWRDQPSEIEAASGIREEGQPNSLLPGPGRMANYYSPVPDISTSGYRVTTEYDYNSDDEAEENQENDNFPFSSWYQGGDPHWLGDEYTGPEDNHSGGEDGDNEERLSDHGRRAIRRHLESTHRQQNLRHREGYDHQTGFTSQIPPDVMIPHARFFIEKEKSMVSIKFDPAPSGRYILIKLWSPRVGGNIDIQSITVHGYAGPRFFPAGKFR